MCDSVKKSPNLDLEHSNVNHELKYSLGQVLSTLIPVCLCMFFTMIVSHYTATAFGIENQREDFLSHSGHKQYFVLKHQKQNDLLTESVAKEDNHMLFTFLIGLLTVGNLIFWTLVILILVKMNKMKIIKIILLLTLLFLFLFINVLFWQVMAIALEITIDSITAFLFIVNIAGLALFCMMWCGPKKITQVLHIYLSIIMAWYLNNLTSFWFGWLMLIILCVWDLCAVLPKYGPLNMIIRTLEKRGQSIPSALIYSVYFQWTLNNKNTSKNDEESSMNEDVKHIEQLNLNYSNNNEAVDQNLEVNLKEENSPKLGLGDFVFYSYLIAKSCTQYNPTTVLSCFMGILIGLGNTILLASYLRKPLPALPISIFTAILVFFSNEFTTVPLMNRLNLQQIFI